MNKSKIFAKVADIANKREEKVELSKAQIELGLVENIAKLSERSKKLENSIRSARAEREDYTKRKSEIEKEYQKLTKLEEKASDKFFKEGDKVDSLLTQIDEALDKAGRAARELGLKPASIDGFKELEADKKNLTKARVGK